MIMSTTDPKKIAFKGTTNRGLQKHIDNYLILLGGINSQRLEYSSYNYYYFISDSKTITLASKLPAGYEGIEPKDYFKTS